MPWNDRAGRLSWIRLLGLTGAMAPALWLFWLTATDGLGARPYDTAIRFVGDWAVYFLLISLAVTPLRRIGWPRLIVIRRLLGLTALAYSCFHLVIYIADLKFDLVKVVTEVVLRFYLTIGFAALLGLAVLGATSTDAMIRRLGRGWNQLHRLTMPIAALAVLHYFLQSKLDARPPALMGGILVLLLLARLAHARGFALSAPQTLASLSVVSAVLTAGLEAGWYAVATGVPPLRVLEANLAFAYSVSSAWQVFAIGMTATLWSLARGLRLSPTRREI